MASGKWQVASGKWPHMGHFYAIVLPRLGNAYTVIGVWLRRTRDADDGADASCADRICNAGCLGGHGDRWGVGGAAIGLLGCQRRLEVSYPLGGHMVPLHRL
jgi:hypothetical protein